jgi:hypothetical protein
MAFRFALSTVRRDSAISESTLGSFNHDMEAQVPADFESYCTKNMASGDGYVTP